MSNRHFYRPEWTCGRYNPDADTAIMYNLIAGVSSFFESYSARVIGRILSIPKNGRGDTAAIAESTGIAEESITDFIDVLMENGLVTDRLYSRGEIAVLRERQGQVFRDNPLNRDLGEGDDGMMDTTDAEQLFVQSLDLDKCIPAVMLELTYNCSEKCIHCYNSGAARSDCEASNRKRSEMSLDDYKRVIDELYALGLYKVCLTGGDPFSKPHIWEIIEYLYERDIAIDIFTNGQSITHDVERLAWYYPRLVGLSIYSAEPEVHDRITRVKGSLSRTLAVAEGLSRMGVNMAFKCVVLRTNFKFYRTVKRIADKYGAIPQFDVNLTNGVDGDVSVVENLGLPDNVKEVLLRDPLVPMHVGTGSGLDGRMAKPLDAHPCSAGIRSFSITPEGYVHPCCAFPTSFGNVREVAISEILKSDSLRKWRKVSVGDISECGRHRKCRYCFLCAGNAFIEHGTPLKPSSFNCHMAELRMRIADKILNGEDPLMGKTIDERIADMEIPKTEDFHRNIKENYRNHSL